MWSVPLIAAVAVIGVLAAYVMLAASGVLAHGSVDTAAHLPPDPVTKIDVSTPHRGERRTDVPEGGVERADGRRFGG